MSNKYNMLRDGALILVSTMCFLFPNLNDASNKVKTCFCYTCFDFNKRKDFGETLFLMYVNSNGQTGVRFGNRRAENGLVYKDI